MLAKVTNRSLLQRLLVIFSLSLAFAGWGAYPEAQSGKTPPEVTAWLKSHVIPITTAEAGNGFADMEPLKAVVGDAHVVALGEGTHGTKEFFKFKHRMLEFLVEEKGFTAFAIEAPFAEALAVNDFVVNGIGDPAQAIRGMHFWTWSTEEVLAMVLWMRQYNEDPGHLDKVKFYGFDMQYSAACTAAALAYLQQVDPSYAATVSAALEKFKTEDWESGYSGQPISVVDADAAAIAAVLNRFDEREADYQAITGEEAWAMARQHVRVLAQCHERYATGDLIQAVNIRDASMSENAQWLLSYEGPGARFVLWAHNGHVSFSPGYSYYTMGAHLKEALGADLVAVGLEFNRGGFQAIKKKASGAYGALTRFNVTAANKTSVNAALASAKIAMFVVDIRSVPDTGTDGAWWHSPHLERSIGSAYGKSWDSQMYGYHTPALSYDAYFFIDRTTAATPLP